MAQYIFSNGRVTAVDGLPKCNRRKKSGLTLVLIFATSVPQTSELQTKGKGNNDDRPAA